jgi:flagellar basal-body rod protein FlgG
MKALAIAATGMSAQETNVEVIANNIANVSTTGFKRSRAEFTDLLYQTERLQGVSSRGNDNTVPEGAQLGLGVRLAAIRSLDTQGTLTSTGNTYDLALNGAGWFQITGPNSETLYTRDGSFNVNGNGQLVTADGYAVSPAITVPQNASSVTVSSTGLVTAIIGSATTSTTLGQLTIAAFPNDSGLNSLGSNLYQETPASGQPVVGVPGDPGFATISQKYLESSNVDSVSELTALISAQRSYEMNSKVIQAADQMSQTVTQMK